MMDHQHWSAIIYPESGRSSTHILTSPMSMSWLNFYFDGVQICAKDNASIIIRFGAIARMVKFRMFELGPEGRESWWFGRKSTVKLLSTCNLCQCGVAWSSHLSINLSVINTSMSVIKLTAMFHRRVFLMLTHRLAQSRLQLLLVTRSISDCCIVNVISNCIIYLSTSDLNVISIEIIINLIVIDLTKVVCQKFIYNYDSDIYADNNVSTIMEMLFCTQYLFYMA